MVDLESERREKSQSGEYAFVLNQMQTLWLSREGGWIADPIVRISQRVDTQWEYEETGVPTGVFRSDRRNL